MKLRALLPFSAFVILVVLLGYGLTRDPKEIPSPLINKPAPEFNLPTVKDPDKMISQEIFLNKVTLFNVWASWCSACRDEHPLIVKFVKQHRALIYGLNYKDDRSDALRWLQLLGDPYISSASDLSGAVGIDWGVYGVPETFLVDKKGIIRYKHIGPVTDDVLNKEILPLINKLEKE
ncbi:MAG TPA: DsbE family thiol:disulfide interchange protein [Gammaproteobacteria bacterium]|nr:DsbE family thiol:disulfide interchange protein [Gammaproteobacteria bacterium]